MMIGTKGRKRAVTWLLAVALIYYVMVKLLSYLLQLLERRLRESDRR